MVRTENGEAIATITLRDALLNALGISHGGVQYHLCTLAMKALVGDDVIEAESSIDYYLSVNPTDEVKAVGRVVKDGKTCVFAQAELYANGRLAAFMTTMYLRGAEQVSEDQVKAMSFLPSSEASVEFALEDNIPDPQYQGREALTKRMLCLNLETEFISQIQGSMAITLRADDTYLNDEGFIDASVLGILVDDALGLASFTDGKRKVTVRLTTRIYQRVKPPVLLRCRGDVIAEIGRFVYVNGTIWADELLIGSCAGIFCKTNLKA